MNIPSYKSINSLLLANETGVISETDAFHIHQFSIKTGVHIQEGKPHRTDFYGVTFIEGGKGEISINGTRHDFENNILIHTSPGQIITASVDNVSNGYVIFFMPEFVNIQKPDTMESLFPFFKLNSNGAFKVGDETGPFKAQFRNMKIEYFKKDVEYMKVIRSYLLVLLNLIGRQYFKNTSILNNHRDKKHTLTTEFESLIRQNMPERKTVTYLAEELSVSSKHLIEVIKATTGKTPSELNTQIFMLEAKKLLLYSNLSVNEVAYRLNFNDPSYFNKVFKKYFNISPLSFKRKR